MFYLGRGCFTIKVLLKNYLFTGVSSSIAKTLGGGSFISKVLLANADALCAAASPLVEEDNFDFYVEKCVMNNYFGIGLDAKIALEFQNKREEHPEKCRSVVKTIVLGHCSFWF